MTLGKEHDRIEKESSSEKRAVSSVEERLPYKEEAAGSSPALPIFVGINFLSRRRR